MLQWKEVPKTIWVIGAGFMGRGIAQICAQYGLSVCLVDPDAQALAEAPKYMIWSLRKVFEKGGLKEDLESVLARVTVHQEPPAGSSADFLIECIPEELSLKKMVFGAYDKICPEKTIFASNTSALPIGKLAISTDRPDRFIGTHFASPPVMQKLVEVIPGPRTSPETLLRTKTFLLGLEREIIEVGVDTAGFVMNRVYIAAAGEAMRLVERRVAPAADIDRAMRLGFGWVKGPLEAADLAGLDVIRGTMISIWQETGDPRFNPPESLTRLVENGHLGRKTGRGFYEYPPQEEKQS